MTESTPAVVVESSDSTTIIRFNRPSERNPLSRQTLTELETALATLDAKTRALVLTGTDDVFASGAHLREVQELTPGQARAFSRLGQRIFQTIAERRQVSIAAINGYCMGGALDLALACDIRIASPNAVFAHPGTRLGIITGWGGTQRLSRLIGRTRTLELLLTARRVDSREAYEIGLVTEVKDPVLEYAVGLAERVVSQSTISFQESD